MRNTNKFAVHVMCVGGLLALMLTGCTKDNTFQGDIIKPKASVKDVSEVQAESSGNIPNEENEVAKVLDAGNESSFDSENNVENQDLIDAAVIDFENYFGLTIDLSQYDVSVFYTKKQGDFDAKYNVTFGLTENNEILADVNNIGSDGFPTKEAMKKLKPEYYASYSDDKKLTGLQASYMNWEEAAVPITIGECKEAAEEFLESNNMITGGEIEFVTSNVISDSRVFLVYKNGTDGAIGIVINTYASKVETFMYMNQKEMELSIQPVKEGMGGVG